MMKTPTYLLTVVALAMSVVSMCPAKSVLAASQRTEVCVETSEQQIASLFDRWCAGAVRVYENWLDLVASRKAAAPTMAGHAG